MRYFGGKSKIAKEISNYINQVGGYGECSISAESKESRNKLVNLSTHTHTIYTHYVEPFCGSCNVATLVKIPNKTLNDKHHYLISMFKALQEEWIPPTNISKEEYDYIKQNKDENKALSGFVGFGCSFSGIWFSNYAKDNTGRNYCKNAHNSILKKMNGLKDATFISKDFSEISCENSLIYCDPPYRNTSPYNKEILGEFPYEDFLTWTKEKSKNNLVLVSEYKHNVPEGAKIVLEINSRTDIKGKNGKQIPTIEILWTWNDL
jgi:DNA adenine methylase